MCMCIYIYILFNYFLVVMCLSYSHVSVCLIMPGNPKMRQSRFPCGDIQGFRDALWLQALR